MREELIREKKEGYNKNGWKGGQRDGEIWQVKERLRDRTMKGRARIGREGKGMEGSED